MYTNHLMRMLAFSSVSSSLSGCAANIWEDILKHRLPEISEFKATMINKVLGYLKLPKIIIFRIFQLKYLY